MTSTICILIFWQFDFESSHMTVSLEEVLFSPLVYVCLFFSFKKTYFERARKELQFAVTSGRSFNTHQASADGPATEGHCFHVRTRLCTPCPGGLSSSPRPAAPWGALAGSWCSGWGRAGAGAGRTPDPGLDSIRPGSRTRRWWGAPGAEAFSPAPWLLLLGLSH